MMPCILPCELNVYYVEVSVTPQNLQTIDRTNLRHKQ